MVGRIGDAVRALRGHAKPCYTCERNVQRLEAEWREFQLSLTGYMEQMNAWAARQAKRDKRALGAVLREAQIHGETPEEVEAVAGALGTGGRKDQLRRRAFGRG